jgi:hypothetical protein
MHINSIANINFNGKVSSQLPPKRFRFDLQGRGGKGSKLITKVYADNCNRIKIIDYKLKRYNETLEEGSYNNKKGFSEEALENICKQIQENVAEKIDYAAEFFYELYRRHL